jgi:hypothetical protein
MPSAQAEHCRQKALECEEEAKRAVTPGMADAWLKMAQQWRLLADQIERSEHLNQDISGLQHDTH